MDITNIKIKNIKGYGDPGLDWNLNDRPIKSNKINLVVAPNGTGKSSITIALEYVTGPRISLQEKHQHDGNAELLPFVSLTLDGSTYSCDNTSNGIKAHIMPHVINSPLVADTKSYHIPGGGVNSLGMMAIENIELQSSVPNKCDLKVNTTEVKNRFGKNSKLLRTINNYLSDTDFVETIGLMRSIFVKYEAQARKTLVDTLIANINALDGTEEEIKRQVSDDVFNAIEQEQYYQQYTGLMLKLHPEFTKLEFFLCFYQLLYLFENNREDFNKAVKRAAFENSWASFNKELHLLDTTGRDIKAGVKANKVVVEYPSADEISNGQRDLLSFYCRLKEFERTITPGKKYLLVIDEIFDYLDDANYIAAQYYLTKFLKGNVDVCIVVMTHLDPKHFRSTVFSDKVLNVIYLGNYAAKATLPFTKFLSLRQTLDRDIAADNKLYDKISAFYLHYNPSNGNIKAELIERSIPDLKSSWGEGTNFFNALVEEVNKYLAGGDVYDPYAVATALRIKIEKSAYDQLPSEAERQEFLTGQKKRTTVQKLNYAREVGADVNEVMYMAIPITNDADHLSFIKGSNILDEHPLIYKLEHPIIRNIVREIFNYQGQPLTVDCIR